jgi:hypothetical protein
VLKLGGEKTADSSPVSETLASAALEILNASDPANKAADAPS